MRIAVLLATYNGEPYIGEFLESLAGQDDACFSVFVRDDGSSDNTLAVVHGFRDRLDIHLVVGSERLGPAASFFELMSKVGPGYDIHLFADQDDIWLPTKIRRASLALRSQSVPALYMTRIEYVDETLNHIAFSRRPKRLGVYNALVQSVAPGCAMAFNDSARRLIISAGPPASGVMHDRWTYFVVSALGRTIFDDMSLVRYRVHSANAVGAARTTLERLRRRLDNLFRRRLGVYSIHSIALEFLRGFSDVAPRSLNFNLRRLVSARTSLNKRVVAAIATPLERQSKIESLLVRMLIVCNRY